jgi:hypothetical protein
MSTTQSQPRRSNRRSAIRHLLRSDIRIECRKGTMGLGPNLTQTLLDLSQTGVCLTAKAPFKKGDEAELLFTGSGVRGFKRRAEVIWCMEREDGTHILGLRFRPELSYAEMQQLTKP